MRVVSRMHTHYRTRSHTNTHYHILIIHCHTLPHSITHYHTIAHYTLSLAHISHTITPSTITHAYCRKSTHNHTRSHIITCACCHTITRWHTPSHTITRCHILSQARGGAGTGAERPFVCLLSFLVRISLAHTRTHSHTHSLL